MTSNTSLYGSSATTGNVGSNNFTTLYSGAGVNLRPTQPYGNANVERFLNAGTDGANSVTNIVNSGTITSGGNITAPWFIGNIVGNISGNVVVTGSNTDVLFNNNGNIGASDALQFNFSSNVLTANGNINANHFNGNGVGLSHLTGANVSGQVAYAGVANSVAGANVSGQVSYAAVANSVSVANVSGIGNIAVVNLDGNVSNVLLGNGSWGPGGGGNAASANFANYAGNVTVSSQPNITSVGTLTSLAVAGNITGPDVVSFDIANGTSTLTTGQMSWTNTEATMNLGMLNGVIQQIGLETYIYVKASSAITDGQVVMFTGASGDNVLAAPADVTSVGFQSEYVIGVATQNIALNGFGYITVFGQVHGLNTNSYNVGDILWLSTTTPGLLVNTQPTDPNYQIQVAAVTKKAGGDGHIQVRVTPFWALTRLTDVNITTPTTGEALVYNGSNVWINGNPNQANYASVANSVAVANVVGIGNIATINLDGNVSNALLGNGSWGPVEVTSTNIANGNSNVSIPVANSSVRVSVSGNANVVTFDGNGTTTIAPTAGGYNNFISMIGYGRSGNTGAQRILWQRYRGNSTANLSVQPGDSMSEMLAIGYNGTSVYTGATVNFRSVVDSSYVANSTIIPAGWQLQVANSTGSQLTHNFYANGETTFIGKVTSTAFSGDGGNLSNIQVGNITGIGNIATTNYDGNGSNILHGNGFWGPELSNGNANYANFAGNLINGTSNINILTANGNVLVSAGGNANIVTFQTTGTTRLTPPAGVNSGLLVDSYSTSGGDVHRISSQRARGNSTTPLSVNPNDRIMRLMSWGHNGTAYQTSSVGTLQAFVDSSYTANTANIPIGWSISVNDTNGGVNNQVKTHNFYSNGSVQFFNNVSLNGSLAVNNNISANTANSPSGLFNIVSNTQVTGELAVVGGNASIGGNLSVLGGGMTLNTSNGSGSLLYINSNATSVSTAYLANTVMSVIWSNVDTSSGISPFRFDQYTSLSSQVGAWRMYRARGTGYANSSPVIAGDQVWQQDFGVQSNTTVAYQSVGGFNATLNSNDTVGNIGLDFTISAGCGTAGIANSSVTITAQNTNVIDLNVSGNIVGNVSIANLQLNKFQEKLYSIGTTSGTLTPDFNNGSIQSVTLNGNLTLNSLGNAVGGRSMTLIITQDGTGGHTLTSSMLFADGYKILSTAAGAKDIISVFYDGSSYYASLTTGYV